MEAAHRYKVIIEARSTEGTQGTVLRTILRSPANSAIKCWTWNTLFPESRFIRAHTPSEGIHLMSGYRLAL